MERVAFLIESTGERIGCLLNPNSVVRRRLAGLRPRRSVGGQLTGTGLADDPLLYTGGGQTELEVELLFDVNLAGSSITTDDVQDLTHPFWDLAENASRESSYGQPPRLRFVWGKSCNIPCVVAAVAERLEQFTPEGTPQRSWLRMRLLRVSEPPPQASTSPSPLDDMALVPEGLEDLEIPEESIEIHQILGGGEGEALGESVSEETGISERVDGLAFRYYGNAAIWRLIAGFNNIDDPLHLIPGMLLRIPSLSALGRAL